MIEFGKQKRIVVKIGSSLLVDDGKVREKWLRILVSDIVLLLEKGHEVVIVSSGAIALGKRSIADDGKKLSLARKQAAAAIGQISLMSIFREEFNKFGREVGQILLTGSDCRSKKRYHNCKSTISTLIKNRTIPIINENDSVAVEEIRIGDNDRLAAFVSKMVSANVMILFSDIDGLYSKNPKRHSDAEFIPEVKSITKRIKEMAEGSSSSVGTGGMTTKLMAARMLYNSKCRAIITSGVEEGSLRNLYFGKQRFTIFNNKNSKKLVKQ